MKKSVRLIVFLLVSALLVELDQITKIFAKANLANKSEGVSIIPGVLKLFYLQNEGAAWGILNGKLNFFIILTCIILLVLVYIVIKMPADKKYNYLFFTIIFLTSGAIGNFIDRIRFAYVRDFIYFELIDFPVFNVADIYVTLSVITLIILIFFVYKDEDFEFLSKKRKSN